MAARPWDALFGMCPEFCQRDRQLTKSLTNSPTKATRYATAGTESGDYYAQQSRLWGTSPEEADRCAVPHAVAVASSNRGGGNTESVVIWGSQALTPRATTTGDCGICCEEGCDNLLSADGCGHYICASCLRQHCKAQLESGRLPHCYQKGCKAEVSPGTMKTVCEGHPDLWHLFKATSLAVDGRYLHCPGCRQAVLLSVDVQEERAQFNTPQSLARTPGLACGIRCPECKLSFCIICLDRCHPRTTCEQNQRARKHFGCFDKSAVPDLPEGHKFCPRCSLVIQKTDLKDSCDHMTCPKCAKEFCWTCLADHKIILAHGNHFHDPLCRFNFGDYPPSDKLERDCPECRRTGKVCVPKRKR